MALTFQLRESMPLSIEGSWCVPSQLAGLPIAEIERLPVRLGHELLAVADLWAVHQAAGDAEEITLSGDHSRVLNLAKEMTSGTLRIEGDAGPNCGTGMSGGRIHISGDAGDGLGRSMVGGRIEVQGNAGHDAAGQHPGARRGMTGGEIFIQGNVGDFAGARIRRGLLWIGGDTGAATGHSLLAGTIIVNGSIGSHAASAMKRGTLVQLSFTPRQMETSFAQAWTAPARFLRLYAARLPADWQFDRAVFDQPFQYWRGDLLELGLGEFLLPAAAAS